VCAVRRRMLKPVDSTKRGRIMSAVVTLDPTTNMSVDISAHFVYDITLFDKCPYNFNSFTGLRNKSTREYAMKFIVFTFYW